MEFSVPLKSSTTKDNKLDNYFVEFKWKVEEKDPQNHFGHFFINAEK